MPRVSEDLAAIALCRWQAVEHKTHVRGWWLIRWKRHGRMLFTMHATTRYVVTQLGIYQLLILRAVAVLG